jgi:preprotein translocase subunit Sec63
MPDPYKTLGVKINATIEEISDKYKEQARKYHPAKQITKRQHNKQTPRNGTNEQWKPQNGYATTTDAKHGIQNFVFRITNAENLQQYEKQMRRYTQIW